MAFLRKYGVGSGANVAIPMVKAASSNFAVGGDWSPSAGDVKVSLDGAAQANIATLPTYTNGDWVFVFSNAELQCKRLSVRIVDSATKAVEDSGFNVETYGHAIAMIVQDLSAASYSAILADASLTTAKLGVFVLAKTTNITGLNDIAATAIVSSGAITTSGGKVSGVILVDTLTTYTGNTVQTGDSFSRIGALGAGLTALAPSSTALSTATWTGTLATNLATLVGKFTGITLLAEWLGLIAGKQTGNTTARTELRATGAGSGTFNETTDSTEAIRDRGDAAWLTGTSGGGVGNGDIVVDHDYGGTDDQRVLDSVGNPVDNAAIRAYVAADFAAGQVDPEPPTTYTGSDGRWVAPLMLDADDYKILVYNPNTKRTKSFDLTVA